MMSAVWISITVGAAATLASVPPAIAVAWVLERTRAPGRGVLQAVAMLPLVLPPVVTGYLLLLLFAPRGPLGFLPVAFTWLGAVTAAAVVGFPLLLMQIRLAMQTVDRRMEIVSRTLGRTEWATFWRITLPLSRPGLLAGALLAFARGLGEFGATVVLAGRIPGETETIALAVYALLEQPGGRIGAAALAAVSVAICLASVLGSRALETRWQRRLEIER